MAKVKFLPFEILVDVDEDDSLLTVAQKAGLTDVQCCGMNPLCGKCKVSIVEGEEALSPMRAKEEEYCRANGFLPYQRLGCVSLVRKDRELWVELDNYLEEGVDKCRKVNLES